MDNDIEFSHEGEVDLLDKNDIVLASAGMILKMNMVVIDPIDHESEVVFEMAGYKIISSKDFDINMLKQ